jgi:mannose-6-phosphate isomerase class I
MHKRLQNISISFTGQSSPHTDDFSIYHFSGNHWDDIFYFPKNYQIGLIHEGQGSFTIGQTEYPLQQNDTYFIRPGLVHKGKPDPKIGWDVSVLNFKAQLIEELEAQGAQMSIFKHFQPAKPLNEAVRKLLSYFEDDVTQEEAKNLVYNFLVECLQNLYHHLDARPNLEDGSENHKTAIFMIGKIENEYSIITGNYMLTKNVENLKSKLIRINGMTKEELKEYYKEVLNNDEFSSKGGGGLGMIDIARKSGQKLNFQFVPVDNNFTFFSLNIKIANKE